MDLTWKGCAKVFLLFVNIYLKLIFLAKLLKSFINTDLLELIRNRRGWYKFWLQRNWANKRLYCWSFPLRLSHESWFKSCERRSCGLVDFCNALRSNLRLARVSVSPFRRLGHLYLSRRLRNFIQRHFLINFLQHIFEVIYILPASVIFSLSTIIEWFWHFEIIIVHASPVGEAFHQNITSNKHIHRAFFIAHNEPSDLPL